jgi:putative addiction module killer protein
MELIETDTFKKWRSGLKDARAAAFIAVRLARLVNGLPGDVSPVGEGISDASRSLRARLSRLFQA